MGKQRIRHLVIFFLGILLSILLWGVSVWADFEASLFSLSMPIEDSLKTLSCPMIISRNETGTISASFKNDKDSRWRTKVSSFISDGYMSLISESETIIELLPGEVRKLQWNVSYENAVWGRVIMVRVYTLRNHPFPSLSNTCGILVLDILGIQGITLLILWVTLSLLLIVVGFYKWIQDRYKNVYDQYVTNFLLTLIVSVVIGIVLTFMGNMVFSLLMGLITILLIAVGIAYLIQVSDKVNLKG